MAARKGRKQKLPWILRLPRGLREQPAQLFIGILVGLAGVSYLLGVSQSTVTQAVGATGLRIWGALLALSGFGVVYATVRARPALEKLALRILSTCMFVYAGWLLAVVPLSRLGLTVALVLALVSLSEIRIAVLKVMLRGEPRAEH